MEHTGTFGLLNDVVSVDTTAVDGVLGVATIMINGRIVWAFESADMGAALQAMVDPAGHTLEHLKQNPQIAQLLAYLGANHQVTFGAYVQPDAQDREKMVALIRRKLFDTNDEGGGWFTTPFVDDAFTFTSDFALTFADFITVDLGQANPYGAYEIVVNGKAVLAYGGRRASRRALRYTSENNYVSPNFTRDSDLAQMLATLSRGDIVRLNYVNANSIDGAVHLWSILELMECESIENGGWADIARERF